MDQKFVSFEDVVKKLGISSERLTKMREEGQLRAYRDGASWKFRTDEIDRLADEGLPDEGPASDISIIGDDDLMPAAELPDLAEVNADEDDLKLADDDLLELDGSGLELSDSVGDELAPVAADDEPSELDLSQEDTVTVDGPSGSDSILLSEEELGESVATPPSTIIGRDELDVDLELELDDDGSDVKLAESSGTGESHVLSSDIAGSGVLSDLEKETGATDAFADLEELEIDLSAESSRVLAEEDAKDLAGKAAADAPSDMDLGDLELDDDGTDPVPAAEEAPAAKADVGGSDIELGMDEDFVLAEAGGSDITLDSGDSGINLISPADSGLALDDIPLDVGGSAILSSLSLDGDDDVDISLMGSEIGAGDSAEPLAELEPEDDFNLTPMGNLGLEDEGDSSSQVIALDADMEGLDAEEEVLGADAFAEVDADAEMGGDYGEEAGIAVGSYGGAAAVKRDSDYNVWSILALGSGAMLLAITAIMLTDMIRNIWGWQQGLTLNSWILDGLLGMFGLNTK
ncbi:MAG: helix-turn-helix domain-containing protein [Planctomycetales bacterium]|nr:helix-turn-helix domain-containing protein [Planctomycetales bacterium]